MRGPPAAWILARRRDTRGEKVPLELVVLSNWVGMLKGLEALGGMLQLGIVDKPLVCGILLRRIATCTVVH